MTFYSLMASSQIKIVLSTGGDTMTATLVENEATSELCELLERGPVTIKMSDYGGFEKVGTLPRSFTTSNSQITTEPGDIMLYQGNNMVIFYGSNSWSYTRLGKIDSATVSNLKQFLGSGDINMTISLDHSTDIDEKTGDGARREDIYDLKGRRRTETSISKGVYIVNGKKIYIKK